MVARVPLCMMCGALVLFHGVKAQAQTTASLYGRVTDATTTLPLIGAQVRVLLEDTAFSAVTNADGTFRFHAVPSGIHRVQVAFLGYGPVLVPEVWLRTGKAEVVDIAMQASSTEIGEVIVEGVGPRHLTPVSSHALTVEQSLRFPATFFDPARLAATQPGVASTNDQANHFSVRGNGPASNAWMLEGAEIVNPNHLTNAGTASDQPTLSGGGVDILSAQMLGTSQLLTGGFPTAYGNALGGIMDMQLRRGATDAQAFTAQVGLIGIDLSTEGPFKKGGDASYLVNYRYSTLGLLSAMGVNLGDEVITFQDLSFHVSLPLGRGSISLFGLGGVSSNTFEAKTDTAEWEFDKDSRNIDYTASMGAVGSSLRIPIGQGAVWHTTAVLSENDQERSEERLSTSYEVTGTSTSALNERKLSVVSCVRGACGARFTYQVGGSAMDRTVQKDQVNEERIEGWLMRPYAQGTVALTDRLRVEAGVAYAHYTFNSSSVVEPRATIQLRIGADRSLSLAAGQRSQLPNVQLFAVQPGSDLWNNSAIGLTRAQDIVLAYDHPFRPHLVLHAEVFQQRVLDVPTGDPGFFQPALNDDGSMVNAWDAPLFLPLTNTGDATNTGVEVSFVHTFRNALFYQVNATLLDAVYTGFDDKERDGRWNTVAIGNVIVGREFVKQKEGLKRTWGVNGRLNGTGGQRVTPIDEELSSISGGTVYDVDRPMAEQLPMFYRVDLRIYLKREHEGRTGMWALDVQNLTGAQNEAYRYYDVRKGEVVTKYQLGLIPNLSYRIEF
ncbi:MAG: TonB-dependent receptor [Flavobacteriales bacterium]